MNRILYALSISCILLVNVAQAADIPEVVEGAEKYDKQNCIQTYTDNCIDNVCTTSEQIDCESNCGKLAQDKCSN
jgi:hypothetical protein